MIDTEASLNPSQAEEMAAALLAAIKDESQECYGLRIMDGEALKAGAEVNDSRIWIDGDATEETLGGSSAVMIGSGYDLEDESLGELKARILAAAEMAKREGYYGDQTALIGGDFFEHGEDLDEVVISNAIVLSV